MQVARSIQTLVAGILPSLMFIFAPLTRGQTFELLYSFQSSGGRSPSAGLVQGSDGNFYGTTYFGGDLSLNVSNGLGTVFKMTTNGILTTLVSFNRTNGALPEGELVQGSDGNFYGATERGGVSDFGTVFKMTPNGILTTLVSFNNTNGAGPWAGLVQAHDGNFYGTTGGGGTNNLGTIFKMTPNGTLTSLFSFNLEHGDANPSARLLQASDGNLYGTTQGDLNNNTYGTIFKMTTNGTVSFLKGFYTFTASYPRELVQATDGNLYGPTEQGTPYFYIGAGTVFKITTNGTLTTLFSFNSSNGRYPRGPLVQWNDGNFYGATERGGVSDFGTVFKMTPNGALTTLVSFNNTNGAGPQAGLLQAHDGNFYGTTSFGGDLSLNSGYGFGTIFRIVMPVSLNSRRSGNELVLSWRTNAFGFTLQSATNLIPPVDWIDSTNTPAVVGTEFTVTNAATESSQFYRLKK